MGSKDKNVVFKVEYLFINFHDNDFFMEMCKSTELLIDAFNTDLLEYSKHKEIIKVLLPKMMAWFYCLVKCSGCDVQKQMNHLEEYFSKGITYLYDIEDIRKHVEKYNYESEYPIKESGIYDDKERLENPLIMV